MTEPNAPADATENADLNDPIDPLDIAEPTEPTDRNDLREAIDSTDPSDHSDSTLSEPLPPVKRSAKITACAIVTRRGWSQRGA